MTVTVERVELAAQVLFHRVMGADADWDVYPDRPKEGFRGDARAVLTMLCELDASEAEVDRHRSVVTHTPAGHMAAFCPCADCTAWRQRNHTWPVPLEDNCGICQQPHVGGRS